MRKKMTMAAVAAMMAVSAYVGANSLTPSEQLSGIMLENVEALAGCEVKNSKNEVVKTCSGNDGVCWGTNTGGGFLYCPGKEVKKKE